MHQPNEAFDCHIGDETLHYEVDEEHTLVRT